MDFNLNKEQEMFQQSLRKLLENTEAAKNSYSKDLWKSLADLGVLSLGIPEELGGFGLDYELIQIAGLELGKSLTHSPFYETVVMAGSVLASQETSTWKKEVEEIISGQKIISFIDTDNHIIADKENHENWNLHGTAKVISFGAEADSFICSASGTLFYIPKEKVNTVPLDFIDNRPVARVNLENIVIPDHFRLCDVGRSEEVLQKPRAVGRLFNASYMTGAAQSSLDLAIDYMNTREQFGKPISSFQALSHWAADLQTMCDAALLFTRQLGWELTNGHTLESSILCLKYSTKVYKNCATASVQMAGGYGFMMEYDMQHFYRNALAIEQINDCPQTTSIDLRRNHLQELELSGASI
ncbi:acyl-CoA dehydrogenase family protein [Neobacillus sp. YX16]|uniref:acyl-CoA dehydrogenase family protein n=1 Tax=Neobacillus sp. YX16 TaxID=3047874 RepID=UPI0024C38EB9|nr:acyl-CoA dehydrogenase family protein [Neobacillus sp. YX16]WHZ05785.1 acyl-CoA dehydrogenase family protein [Neobacillus sp. YX16]